MKYLLFIFAMLLSITAYTGFGGSRGGSSFSSSRSYSSPSRSYSSPTRSVTSSSSFGSSRSSATATVTRPQAPVSSGSYGSPIHTQTIIHEVPVGGGGGFWTNMFMYQMLFGHNQQQQPVVVVNGENGQVAQTYAPAIPVQQGHGFFYYFFWAAVWLFLVYLAYCLIRIFMGKDF